MLIDEDEYLAHYGILRKSGRYPWGSGETQSARNRTFLDTVDDLKRQGMSEVDIARAFSTDEVRVSTTQLRAARSIAKNEQKQLSISTAQKYQDKGMSNVAIGLKMGLNESSVRALLAPGAKDKAEILQSTTNILRKSVAEKKYIDVGAGVEYQLGISDTKLKVAVAQLREEGYTLHYLKVPQLGAPNDTSLKVLAAPDVTYSEVHKNRDQITQIQNFSDDGGRSYLGLHPPVSVSSNRVGINYGPDGGAQADGVIFVRPGVKDVSLGSARYAQVRVMVDGTHYIKGMAMYRDDLPAGTDLVFNTNKESTGNKLDALKKISDDPDNPFGATVRQIVKRESDGKEFLTEHGQKGTLDGTEKVTSAMNIVHEEGNWSDWSKTISTQMLSKQSPSLAKTQLNMTYEQRLDEFDKLNKLTNPTVRRTLLEKFGDETSSAAVHLDAAAISTRQGWHAILPIESMRPTEIYAPNFRDGERVVLIRFPHAGTFEIPELTVNNNHPEASKLLGPKDGKPGARDAVGIHHSVAERLSGADFDGDTVLVIPNNSNKVKPTAALDGLKNFDPRSQYKGYEGMPRMTPRQKGAEMGGVSNLITDMTLRGASTKEMTQAVKHSMVVIDAEKHNLNYKQSAIDNGIAALKEKYQGRSNAGASTLISRATADTRINARKPRPAAEGGAIDKLTGKRIFVDTGETNFKTGAPRKLKVERLAVTDDAHDLSSGTPMERVYAEHSNKLKALGDLARKESVNTPLSRYSPSAKQTYHREVTSLNSKLAQALTNAPLERQAQLVGNAIVRTKREQTPDMDQASLKKIKAQALNEARTRTGAKKTQIKITSDEWNAIQAGAISDSKLSRILNNADIDEVKKLASPREAKLMTSSKTLRATAMLSSGYTRAEVADALGVSLTTLNTATTGDGGSSD